MPVRVVKKNIATPSPTKAEPTSYYAKFNKKKKDAIDDMLWKSKKGPNGRLITEKQVKLVKKMTETKLVNTSIPKLATEVGYKGEQNAAHVTERPSIQEAVKAVVDQYTDERQAILDEMKLKRRGANYASLVMALKIVDDKINETNGMMPRGAEIRIAEEDRNRLDKLFEMTGRRQSQEQTQ